MISAAKGGQAASLDEVLLGFVQALRRAGLVVATDQVLTMVRAVGLVSLLDRDAVATATRASCCFSPEDLVVHDRVFAEYFEARAVPSWPGTRVEVESPEESLADQGVAEPGTPRPTPHPGERLARRPLRGLDDQEREEALRLLATLRLVAPMRRVRRRVRGGGQVDPRATTRALMRTGTELPRLRCRQRARRPRRVVVLVDVSASMRPWVEPNLRFAHALHQAQGAEVFTLGTRLTRVSAELSTSDVSSAVGAAGAKVPDWSGGTRLSSALGDLVTGWGRRGPLRGAVLVIMSDGLETGDPADFEHVLARAARLTHRIVWVHPRAGTTGWRPATRALVAALDHLDQLVGGGSVAELEHAGRVIAGDEHPGSRHA